MPRTKSTATLEAAKRDVLLNEPFSINKLANNDELSLVDRVGVLVNFQQWNNLAYSMARPNTATKFFGTCIHNFPKAKEWFTQVDDAMTHEIFCLIRSPREVMLSHVLATQFGYHSTDEKETKNVVISDEQLMFFHEPALQHFLRYYPKNAKTVTFETLPSEFFNYRKINSSVQNSIELKQNFILNLSEVKRKIDIILRVYQREWEQKTGTDIFA